MKKIFFICIFSLQFASASYGALQCSSLLNENKNSSVFSANFIVPVYRELYSKNIENFLNRIEEQEKFDAKVRVLLMINNTVEVARDKNSKIFIENQKTIEQVREWISDSKYSFQIEFIDLSTKGFERNMGKLRQVGVDYLLRKSMTAEDIVIHSDADTTYKPNFLKNLLGSYKKDSTLDTIFLSRTYDLRGGSSTIEMIGSHFPYRFERLKKDLRNFIHHFKRGFATYQITSRSTALKSVGGFKPLERGEDTRLSKDLLASSNKLAHNLKVSTEDRARPDAFTGAIRFEGLKSGKSGVDKTHTSALPYRLLTSAYSKKLIKDVQSKKINFAEAVKQFRENFKTLFGIDLVVGENYSMYVKLNEKVPALVRKKNFEWDKEQGPLEDLFSSQLYQRVDYLGEFLIDTLSRNLPKTEFKLLEDRLQFEQDGLNKQVSERSRALKQALKGESYSGNDPFILWVINKNSDFKQVFEGLKLEGKSIGYISRVLKNEFPDWLKPGSGSRTRMEIVRMEKIMESMNESTHSPELYPGMYEFVSSLRF